MDFSIYRTPEPNRRVWSNVFVDSKTESYTLVTEQNEEGQPGYPLWHKEYPIGQGLADFLYTNLAEVEKVILQFRDAFEACAAGDGEADALQDAHDHVFFTCKYCLDQTPLLLPLVMRMEQVRLQQKTLEDVLSMLEEYKELQPKLSFIAHEFFENEKTEKTLKEYQERLYSDPKHFILLEYGSACYGDTWLVYNNPEIRYPYDTNPEVFLDDNFQIIRQDVKPPELAYGDILNTDSPEMLSAFLIRGYIQASMRYKSCKFCHKLFGVTSGRPLYCSRRLDASIKTCKEAGSLRLYEQKMMEDPALREYKKSYKTHNARIRRGQMTREEFDAWAEEARAKRDLYVAGKLFDTDFITWLNQDIRN